jgi:hypothetical protein
MTKAGCFAAGFIFLTAITPAAVAVLLQSTSFSEDIAMNEFHLMAVLL